MNITHDIYTRYSKCLCGLPIVRNLLVKNSGLTTLHGPFDSPKTGRIGKYPGKVRMKAGDRSADVVKPEFLTSRETLAGTMMII